MDVIDQVIMIYAGTRGYLDKTDIKLVPQYEKDVLAFMHDQKSDFMERLRSGGSMSDELEEELKAALVEFNSSRG
jgi:F-type H+-transporting ATPase subunit alpha